MVALQLLRKTDPTLIRIIKTEYSTDLRKNVQVAQFLPSSAPTPASVGGCAGIIPNFSNHRPPRRRSEKVQTGPNIALMS